MMGSIGKLLTLEDLDLSRTWITSKGLASLAPLSRLKKLQLNGCRRLDASSLEVLAKLPHLELLALVNWPHRRKRRRIAQETDLAGNCIPSTKWPLPGRLPRTGIQYKLQHRREPAIPESAAASRRRSLCVGLGKFGNGNWLSSQRDSGTKVVRRSRQRERANPESSGSKNQFRFSGRRQVCSAAREHRPHVGRMARVAHFRVRASDRCRPRNRWSPTSRNCPPSNFTSRELDLARKRTEHRFAVTA